MHERQPVAHVVFDDIVAEILECRQDQHLEHQDLVHRLAHSLALVDCVAALSGGFERAAQRRPEIPQIDRPVQRDQRMRPGAKALVKAAEVETPGGLIANPGRACQQRESGAVPEEKRSLRGGHMA